MKLVGLAALFAAGLLVAGVAADAVSARTATDTTTTMTVTQPTTVTSTVQQTTTVGQTTTAPATTVLATTTAVTTVTTTTNSTETWVWVLVALLGAGVIALAALLFSRRGSALPDSERRLRLQGAINSWAAQGWALTSETVDTAVMQRGGEHMMLTVDPAGQVVSRPATTQVPRPAPGSQPPPPQSLPPEDQPTRELPPDDPWPGTKT